MITRDFFKLMLKLFGLYMVIVNLFAIPTYISYLIPTISFFEGIGFVFISFTIMAIFFYLLFKPDILIDLFKLDHGFENNYIPFDRIDSQSILKVGIIVIGGLLFVRNISNFLVQSYLYLKAQVAVDSITSYYSGNPQIDKVQIATAFVNLVVSWLLLTNYKKISEFLLDKASPKEPEPLDHH